MRIVRSAALLLLPLFLACGGEEESDPDEQQQQPPPPESCDPPNRVVGDACIEPGVQDDGCPAASTMQDGSCVSIDGTPACPAGQIALPGETECHAIMDCGSGQWGTLPTDANTVHVDQSFAGTSNGSAAAPFTTIGAALMAAAPGAFIAVAAGTYNEDITISQPVQLWGVCPDAVTVAGVDQQIGIVNVSATAAGSVIGGMAVTGDNPAAVALNSAEAVVFDSLWIHGLGGRGINAEPTTAPVSMTIRNTLIELATEVAMRMAGGHAELDGVVVRATRPSPASRLGGCGISFEMYNDMTSSTGVVRRSIMELNHGFGASVNGSAVDFEQIISRGTLPQQLDGLFGRGLEFQADLETAIPSTSTIVGSLFEANHSAAISVAASSATIRGVLVRDNIESPNPNDGGGRGIHVQASRDQRVPPATVVVRGSRLERNGDVGIISVGTKLDILGVAVLETHAKADGRFGDGIVFTSEIAVASGTVANTLLTNNARAGLASFGGTVTLVDNTMVCQAFDLNAEPLAEHVTTFEDQGGNLCGCPDATEACRSVSAGLQPPAQL